MITLSLLAQRAGDNDGRWGHMDGCGGGWMWLWGTLMNLSWVGIIAAAVWAVSRSRDGTRPSRQRANHDERYANGELTTAACTKRIGQLRRAEARRVGIEGGRRVKTRVG